MWLPADDVHEVEDVIHFISFCTNSKGRIASERVSEQVSSNKRMSQKTLKTYSEFELLNRDYFKEGVNGCGKPNLEKGL